MPANLFEVNASLLILTTLLSSTPELTTNFGTSYFRFPERASHQVWKEVFSSHRIHKIEPELYMVRPNSQAALRDVLQLRQKHDVKLGHWTPVRMDTAALESLLISNEDIRIEKPRVHRTFLTKSRKDVGVNDVSMGRGLKLARRGAGVLVGVIDTGIDLSHPAFLGEDGQSRVIAVWDQDAVGQNGPRGFDYGRLCDEKSIQENRCTISDPLGHGTHVAGIAAGGEELGGMAPEADIAVVRSEAFTQLADAIDYLVELSEQRGQALVINVSVGGHYGAHDGRTPLERFIESRIGPGVIIVAAAGNDGGSRIHLGHDFGAGESARIRLGHLPSPSSSVEAIVEFWTEPLAEFELSLELHGVDGPLAELKLNGASDEYLEGTLRHEGLSFAELSCSSEVNISSRRVHHTIQLSRKYSQGFGAGQFLALNLRAQGRVDAWIGQSDYRFGIAEFSKSDAPGWLSGDGEMSLAVPSTSPGVITVGAYASRLEWVDYKNEEHAFETVTAGDLAPYSSRGPTTAPGFTGLKPELSAPGSVIESARALSVPDGPEVINDERLMMQGTSMAAPHVTGVVALMLEANPRLSPQDIREILEKSSRRDGYTNDAEGSGWGFGKLDAHAAVVLAEQSHTAGGCQNSQVYPLSYGMLLLFMLIHRRRQSRRGHLPA